MTNYMKGFKGIKFNSLKDFDGKETEESEKEILHTIMNEKVGKTRGKKIKESITHRLPFVDGKKLKEQFGISCSSSSIHRRSFVKSQMKNNTIKTKISFKDQLTPCCQQKCLNKLNEDLNFLNNQVAPYYETIETIEKKIIIHNFIRSAEIKFNIHFCVSSLMSIFNVGPAVIKTINNSYNPTLSILELKELFANRNKGNINQKKTNDTIIELIEKYIETLQVSPLTNTRYGPANVTCWESLFRCFLLYNDSVKDFLKVTTFKKYVQEYLASVNQDIKWVSSSQSQCKNCNILTKNLQDKEDLLKEKLLNYSNSKRLVSQIHDSQSLVSQIHDSQGLVSQINDSQTQRLVSQTHGSQSLVSQIMILKV